MTSNTAVTVSVVMSIFKEPKNWLKECIDSILNQTFEDFEFIIINDNPNSDFNSILLNEYKSIDSRIKIINNQENIGLTKSLNLGLKIANGKYIARIDGDDISLPKRLELQVKTLDNNIKIQLLGTQGRYIKGSNYNYGVMTRPITKSALSWVLSVQGSPIIHSSAMFRSSDKNGKKFYYNESFRKKQDFELWSRLYREGDIGNIKYVGVLYRVHNAQTVKTYSKDDYLLTAPVIKNNLEYIYKLPKIKAKNWSNYLNFSRFNKDFVKLSILQIFPSLAKIARSECITKDELKHLDIFISHSYIKFSKMSLIDKSYKATFYSWFSVLKIKPFLALNYLLPRLIKIYVKNIFKSIK
jgi:glycosyltransferase involved in cell wall biosynthesis